MKVLGLDPASTTGWSLIEDDKIVDYGTIVTTGSMSIGQRLNYIALEIDRLLDKIKPDMIAIEDVLLGISGVKTLSLLARISGVIIQHCYNMQWKRGDASNIHILNVASWKKDCGLGLKGTAPKWQIQLHVVNHFDLINEAEHHNFNSVVVGELDKHVKMKEQVSILKKQKHVEEKNGKKQKIDNSTELKLIQKQIDSKKKELKLTEKGSNKVFQNMMKDIYSITGISEDVADSIAIALAARNLQTGT